MLDFFFDEKKTSIDYEFSNMEFQKRKKMFLAGLTSSFDENSIFCGP